MKNIRQAEPNALKLFRVQIRDTELTVRDTERIVRNAKPTIGDDRPTVGSAEPIYEFWHKTNMPEMITSEKFFLQKLNYIHENPQKRNYVTKPEDWYWSSANKNCELKTDSWV